MRRAVSVAVFGGEGGGSEGEAAASRRRRRPELLTVRRPADDEELPGVWGLPAASAAPGEDWEAAAARVGREKLGVRLERLTLLNEGRVERAGYVLRMRLYRARIAEGKPSVPQAVEGVTQYTAWRWAAPEALREAAERGSLCSRLCLEALGRDG